MSRTLLGLALISRSTHLSLDPEIVRTIGNSRVVINYNSGVITITGSPLDCVFCGAIAERTLHGRGVCKACADGAKKLLE